VRTHAGFRMGGWAKGAQQCQTRLGEGWGALANAYYYQVNNIN
jgi:hypothetical protein